MYTTFLKNQNLKRERLGSDVLKYLQNIKFFKILRVMGSQTPEAGSVRMNFRFVNSGQRIIYFSTGLAVMSLLNLNYDSYLAT